MASENRWTPAADRVLVADLTVPCHHCGISCCGTVAVWFVRAGIQHWIEIDRATLGEMLTRLWRGPQDNLELPPLVRAYFDWTGWMAPEAPATGTAIAYDEMSATLALLAASALDEHERKICEALQRLTLEARATAAPLFIRDD